MFGSSYGRTNKVNLYQDSKCLDMRGKDNEYFEKVVAFYQKILKYNSVSKIGCCFA
jgi:hypothetical protein